jgi:hypothetical protein
LEDVRVGRATHNFFAYEKGSFAIQEGRERRRVGNMVWRVRIPPGAGVSRRSRREITARLVSEIDADALCLEGVFDDLGEVIKKRFGFKHRAQASTSLSDGALVIVGFSIEIAVEGSLDPTLQRLEKDCYGDGSCQGLKERYALFFISRQSFEEFGESKKDKSGRHDGGHVNDTLSDDDTYVHEAIAYDGVRRKRHNEEREVGPESTVLRGFPDDRNEKIGCDCASASEEDSQQEITQLELSQPGCRAYGLCEDIQRKSETGQKVKPEQPMCWPINEVCAG